METCDIRHSASQGTCCWNGLCLDLIGVLAPDEPMMVRPGERLTFTLTAGTPADVHLRVLEWLPGEFLAPPGGVFIDVAAPLVASGDLPPERVIGWEAPDQEGEYSLSLFSSYVEGGDISYGWHVVVVE
jgi:hypothetical protein